MSTDGRTRCDWALSAPDYLAYHDEEWGTALHGERELFERLSLEAFQSGLSWLVILRKRTAFRAAFAGFDIDAVAAFDTPHVHRLLADAGIVRNRAKIEATIGNARAIRDAVPEGLDELLWSFAPAAHQRPAGPAAVRADKSQPSELWDPATWVSRATSPESVAMAKELRKRGLRFVGPTTAHSLMQAVGMFNEHKPTCWRADPRWRTP